jgi:hypothetical protein
MEGLCPSGTPGGRVDINMRGKLWYNKSMKWRTIVDKAAPALLVILLISYFAGGWDAIPEGLVAWGTILLAYATYQLGRTSIEQNGRLIAENRAKEERDRKEQLLNEIIEWAENVINFNIIIDPVSLATVQDKKPLPLYFFSQMLIDFWPLSNKSKRMKIIASKLGSDLASAVNELTRVTFDHGALIQKCENSVYNGCTSEELSKITVEIVNHREKTLRPAAHKVIEEATNLKIAGVS